MLFEDGHHYEYTLRPKACDNPDKERCVYDDSNGRTDCETFGDYAVGDERECWIFYQDNVCQKCSCNDCDDDSRGAIIIIIIIVAIPLPQVGWYS